MASDGASTTKLLEQVSRGFQGPAFRRCTGPGRDNVIPQPVVQNVGTGLENVILNRTVAVWPHPGPRSLDSKMLYGGAGAPPPAPPPGPAPPGRAPPPAPARRPP